MEILNVGHASHVIPCWCYENRRPPGARQAQVALPAVSRVTGRVGLKYSSASRFVGAAARRVVRWQQSSVQNGEAGRRRVGGV